MWNQSDPSADLIGWVTARRRRAPAASALRFVADPRRSGHYQKAEEGEEERGLPEWPGVRRRRPLRRWWGSWRWWRWSRWWRREGRGPYGLNCRIPGPSACRRRSTPTSSSWASTPPSTRRTWRIPLPSPARYVDELFTGRCHPDRFIDYHNRPAKFALSLRFSEVRISPSSGCPFDLFFMRSCSKDTECILKLAIL